MEGEDRETGDDCKRGNSSCFSSFSSVDGEEHYNLNPFELAQRVVKTYGNNRVRCADQNIDDAPEDFVDLVEEAEENEPKNIGLPNNSKPAQAKKDESNNISDELTIPLVDLTAEESEWESDSELENTSNRIDNPRNLESEEVIVIESTGGESKESDEEVRLKLRFGLSGDRTTSEEFAEKTRSGKSEHSDVFNEPRGANLGRVEVFRKNHRRLSAGVFKKSEVGDGGKCIQFVDLSEEENQAGSDSDAVSQIGNLVATSKPEDDEMHRDNADNDRDLPGEVTATAQVNKTIAEEEPPTKNNNNISFPSSRLTDLTPESLDLAFSVWNIGIGLSGLELLSTLAAIAVEHPSLDISPVDEPDADQSTNTASNPSSLGEFLNRHQTTPESAPDMETPRRVPVIKYAGPARRLITPSKPPAVTTFPYSSQRAISDPVKAPLLTSVNASDLSSKEELLEALGLIVKRVGSDQITAKGVNERLRVPSNKRVAKLRHFDKLSPNKRRRSNSTAEKVAKLPATSKGSVLPYPKDLSTSLNERRYTGSGSAKRPHSEMSCKQIELTKHPDVGKCSTAPCHNGPSISSNKRRRLAEFGSVKRRVFANSLQSETTFEEQVDVRKSEAKDKGSAVPWSKDILPNKRRRRRARKPPEEESNIRGFIKLGSAFPWSKQFTNVLDPQKTRFFEVHNGIGASLILSDDVYHRDMNQVHEIPKCSPSTTKSTCSHIIFRNWRFRRSSRHTIQYFSMHGREVLSLAFQDCSFKTYRTIQLIIDRCPRLTALSIYNCPTLFQNLKDVESGRPVFLNCLKKLRRLEIYDEAGIITNGRIDNRSVIGEQILNACDDLQSILIQGQSDSLPILVSSYLNTSSRAQKVTEVYLDFSAVAADFFPDYILPEFYKISTTQLRITNVILKNISFAYNLKRSIWEEKRNEWEAEQLAHFFNKQRSLNSVEFQSNFPFRRDSDFVRKFPRGIRQLKFSSIEVCYELGLEQLVLQSRKLESLEFENTELSNLSVLLTKYLKKPQTGLKNLSVTLADVEESFKLNTGWNFLAWLPTGAPELTQLDLSRFSHDGLQPKNYGCLNPIFGLKNLKVLILSWISVEDGHFIANLGEKVDLFSTMKLALGTRDIVRRHVSILSLTKLETLKLDHTRVGNNTLGLMARYMDKLKTLDISYTRADLMGLKFAVEYKNEFSVLRMVGCGLPKKLGGDLARKLKDIREFEHLETMTRSGLNIRTSN